MEQKDLSSDPTVSLSKASELKFAHIRANFLLIKTKNKNAISSFFVTATPIHKATNNLRNISNALWDGLNLLNFNFFSKCQNCETWKIIKVKISFLHHKFHIDKKNCVIFRISFVSQTFSADKETPCAVIFYEKRKTNPTRLLSLLKQAFLSKPSRNTK